MSEPAATLATPPAPRVPSKRRRKPLVIGLCVVVFLAGGYAVWSAVTRDTRDDLAKLQGEWKFTRPGVADEGGPGLLVRIDGERWSFVAAGVERSTFRIELDPAANPKRIDLIRVRADGSPDVFAHKGKPVEMRQLGVYTLDSDTLTVALNPANDGRPKSLDDVPPATYTRVKK